MKLKAIEKICKASKTVILWPTEDGRVFAGDGGAFYLLPDALSKIPASNMLNVFDVPADKQSDWWARVRAERARRRDIRRRRRGGGRRGDG